MDELEITDYVVDGFDPSEEWFRSLGDVSAKSAVIKRLDRLRKGNLGDHRFVGEGVWELRAHAGPGYRVYYAEDGARSVLLLGAGHKARQAADIALAKRRWAEFRGRQ